MEKLSPLLKLNLRKDKAKHKKASSPIIPVGATIIENIKSVIKKNIIVSRFLTNKLFSDKFEKTF